MNQPGSFRKFDLRVSTLLRKVFQLEIYVAVKVEGKYTIYTPCPETFSNITVVNLLQVCSCWPRLILIRNQYEQLLTLQTLLKPLVRLNVNHQGEKRH